MEKLYPLPSLESVRGKHEVTSLSSFGADCWFGELDNSKLIVIIGCLNHIVKIKIGKTEYEAKYRNKAIDVFKLNRIYHSIGYITVPPHDCEIKIILNMLEWKYDDDEIWC